MACVQTHVLIHSGSHSETFMILILHRFPNVSWRENPRGSYGFTWHYWIALYFSRLTDCTCQVPSSAAVLCKAVLYLGNSEPGFLYLGMSLTGFQSHSDTSRVRGCQAFSRLDLFRNWMVLRHTSLCPHAANLPAPRPCPTCRLGSTPHSGHCLGFLLAALPRERLSLLPPSSSALVSLLAFRASPVQVNRLKPKEMRKVHGACPTMR